MTQTSVIAAIDSLLAKAEAARKLPILSPQRNAELLLQHAELTDNLRMLRAYVDGIESSISVLSERVNALASLYSESQPGKGDWTIKPTMSTRFRARLHALLDLVRDMGTP